jgi:hypothetical protein
MNEETRMTSKELKVLSAFDRGEDPEKTAQSLNLSVLEVRTILNKAKEKREKLKSEVESADVAFVYYRTIDSTLNIPQKGTMKVGSKILQLLSEGIYTSPANSIKELISNAFDADATTVNISFNDEELVVFDNGKGMDYKDFDEEFVYISRSRKRDKGGYTKKFNRPIIGFIGIGFVAVSELCDMLTITSAKEGSDLMFEAKIDFAISREREAVEKEFYEVSRFELTNYKKVDKGYDRDAHFTEIRLKGLKPVFKEMILDKKPFLGPSVQIHEIMDYLGKMETRTFADLGKYWRFLLELAYISPVTYLENGPVKKVPKGSEEYKLLEKIKNLLTSYNFKVTVNGADLKKPFLFPIQGDKTTYGLNYKVHPFYEDKVVDGKQLSFFGYIYSQHGTIDPKEYNGIIIRIRNVAIGDPDTTLLGYPLQSNLVFRHWVFGEIYVTEGLEEAMTIDRSSLKFNHTHYLYLQKFIHNFLEQEVFEYTLHDYYYAKRDRKKQKVAEQQNQLLTKMVRSETDNAYTLELSPQKSESPVVVDRKKQKVIVNRKHSTFRQVRKRERPIIERLMILIEISAEKSGGDVQKMKKILQDLIKKWF